MGDKWVKFSMVSFLFMLVWLSGFFIAYYFHEPTQEIVTVDVVKIVEMGQQRYVDKETISAFSRRLEEAISNYSKENNVIIISKQVVLRGAKDVTINIATKVF